MRFEWDSTKAAANLAKHGISFEEAATAFRDPLSLTVADPDHSDEEPRFILMGETFSRKLIVVVHTERSETIRIISARLARRNERKAYEDG